MLKNKLPYTGTIRYDGPEFAVYEMEQNAPNLMAERTVSQTIQLAIETKYTFIFFFLFYVVVCFIVEFFCCYYI